MNFQMQDLLSKQKNILQFQFENEDPYEQV
jgi:hypothetical protein